MSTHNYAVILAGGQGQRFWPQSRTQEPKQFLCLYNNSTLFEETVSRIKPLVAPENIFVTTNVAYRTQILKFLRVCGIPQRNLILEPEGKNTAPAIAVACRLIRLRDPLGLLCVLPCDHRIDNHATFIRIMKQALAACDDSLIVFGIPPQRPATGYGYLKIKSQQLTVKSGRIFWDIDTFHEKPTMPSAEKFVSAGNYFWHSGIVVSSCQMFEDEFRAHLPQVARLCANIKSPRDVPKVWNAIEPISFDRGVLEKSTHIRMIIANSLGWSDIGSWQVWDQVLKKDAHGNAFRGNVISVKSCNTSVWGTKRVIACVGLDDLIIVDTPDAVLITRKGASEDVKMVVAALKKASRHKRYV